jgi:hypothetical protein
MSELVDPDGLLAHPRVAALPWGTWVTTASEMATALDVALRGWSEIQETSGRFNFDEWEMGVPMDWDDDQYPSIVPSLIRHAFADLDAQLRVLLTYLWIARAALLGRQVRSYTKPDQYAEPGPTLCTPANARPTVRATHHLIIRQRLWMKGWSLYYEVAYVTQAMTHSWSQPDGWVMCTADFEMDHGARVPYPPGQLDCIADFEWLPTLWRPGPILEREAAACAARRTADEIRDRQDSNA